MRKHRSKTLFNIWPGFVDALSALLLVILFTLTFFIIAQFYLTDTVHIQGKTVNQLEQAVANLSKKLDFEKKKNFLLIEQHQKAGHAYTKAQEKIDVLKLQVEELNQRLKTLGVALQQAEGKAKAQDDDMDALKTQLQNITEEKMKELVSYRSEFFGKLRETLGNRGDMRIVGDRFVFQSEVLFEVGSDQIGHKGKKTLLHLAKTLKEISEKIPDDLSWVLRIDGHTDNLPINTHHFPSNWELSVARATSVVKYLIFHGINPKNLAVAGFAEFHPIDPGTNPESRAKNRRIELKLDQN